MAPEPALAGTRCSSLRVVVLVAQEQALDEQPLEGSAHDPVPEQAVVASQFLVDELEDVHPGASAWAAQVHGGPEGQRAGEIGAQQRRKVALESGFLHHHAELSRVGRPPQIRSLARHEDLRRTRLGHELLAAACA